MRLFNMWAGALGATALVCLGAPAQAIPFFATGAKLGSAVEQVRYRYYGVGCNAPYVSVGGRCVYAGYASPYRRRYAPRYYGGPGYYVPRYYAPRYYGGYYGVACNAPYVSVGDRCVYGGYSPPYGGGYYGGGPYGGGYGYGVGCNSPYVSVGGRCVRAF